MIHRIAIASATASLWLAACGAQATPMPPTPATPAGAAAPLAQPGALPTEALKNATYTGIYAAPVTLTNGLFKGEPFVKGDTSRPVVEYINGEEVFGDLDGDGSRDAVVFLSENSGGSATITYVAAQLNRAGRPVDAGAVMIEDRVGIRSAAIANGRIALEVITQGPGDAACCSSHKASKTYAVQGGKLVETTPKGGSLVKVSQADLAGTSWKLLELDKGKPAVAGTDVGLRFADGQLSGSAGCNTYTGAFALGKDNPFILTVSGIAATQRTCPGPIADQEVAYLAALKGATRWSYAFGKLAVFYPAGSNREGRLLFAAQSP